MSITRLPKWIHQQFLMSLDIKASRRQLHLRSRFTIWNILHYILINGLTLLQIHFQRKYIWITIYNVCKKFNRSWPIFSVLIFSRKNSGSRNHLSLTAVLFNTLCTVLLLLVHVHRTQSSWVARELWILPSPTSLLKARQILWCF